MTTYDAAVASARTTLADHADVQDCIPFATLAASGHNTQPWRFRIGEGHVAIRPDFARRTPVVDPDDHHLFVSLGCAAENLSLASGARGRPGAVTFDPAGDGAVVFVVGDGGPSDPALVEAIPRRQSTRAPYDGRPVSAADLGVLAAASATPGVDLVLITERAPIDRARDLVIASNTAQMADPAFVHELKTWLRFSPREALATADGLFSATTGNPTLPSWLGRRVFDMVFRAEACQRFALQATALGLRHAFVNQPVEVSRLRPELAALVGLPGRRPDIVMRFGYGAALPYSARRPVSEVVA